MNDKILKGMVEAMDRAGYQTRQGLRTEYMAHALCWLAENVSDEMVHSAFKAFLGMHHPDDDMVDTIKADLKDAISAAILKASESGE